MTFWSSKKLELSSIENAERRFFVRIPADKLEKAAEVFPGAEVVKVASLADECGLVTGVLSEKEFEKKAETLGGVISRIRME